MRNARLGARPAWYNRRVPGLGSTFLFHVEECLDRIVHYPESYQLDFGVVRRAVTRRYPFAVYYRVLPQAIEVLAILDCRLDPQVVQTRFDTSTDDPA